MVETLRRNGIRAHEPQGPLATLKDSSQKSAGLAVRSRGGALNSQDATLSLAQAPVC